MGLTLLLYTGLIGLFMGKRMGKQIWWKVLLVVLCIEFANWNFLLPYLNVARLGSTDYSPGGVLVDFITSSPGLIFLYIYAFRSSDIWSASVGEDGI